ncbi:MAG: helix-turn-helix transcriptional regulator [Ktedonobacteraceae bacterium]|nr:helix-turn-helix transcriptional regulator [Ktedonobacteraceae bacterium]
MQKPISECIRQLRRQRGMTQTELGGEHFSKSYVSAVEREKIVPSYEALRFFAEQLDQSVDYFHQLAEQSALMQSNGVQMLPSLSLQDENDQQDESMGLLGMVLEGIELPHAPFSQEISALSLETIMRLPFQKQARYCLVKGLLLQEAGNLVDAQHLLERALVLSPVKHQPAILDALGTNFALAHIYQAALSYHRRALHLLELNESDEKASSTLLLKVELHCGDDYRALDIHTKALDHYEHARQSLRSTSNMDIAGQTYMGLGYCTYASTYQNGSTKLSYQEKERQLQRAISFLLQSRTLYQVSSNRMGESKVRLLHALILLALCSLRRQLALERAGKALTTESLQCNTLLDEAEEQCRQALLSWNGTAIDTGISSTDLEVVLYTALSSLVSVYVQRAAVARLEGYSDTALRDRARAALLCQSTLDTLTNPELLHPLLQNTPVLEDVDMYRVQALPRLPDATKNRLSQNPISLAALFFAAGEMTEELGRAATTTTYASDCYMHANTCFKTSLNTERQSTFSKEYDASYLTRNYQRCITLLEERLQVAPAAVEKTYQATLDLFKDSVYQTK